MRYFVVCILCFLVLVACKTTNVTNDRQGSAGYEIDSLPPATIMPYIPEQMMPTVIDTTSRINTPGKIEKQL